VDCGDGSEGAEREGVEETTVVRCGTMVGE